MIFYLVPAAQGRPAMLQPTQADANREARDRGLKVRAPDMEHEVPTSKAELMAYINDLMAGAGGPVGYSGSIPGPSHPDDDEAGPDTTSLRSAAMASDGHPEHRSAYTSAQVAASTLPGSTKVQDICHAVAKLNAGELGFVALEVIARGARLGGLNA